MINLDCKNYRRLSIVICLALMLGLMSNMNRSIAGSGLKVRLVITDTFVTKKTYPLANGKHRQLQVRLSHAFGKVKTKYSSDDPSIASVTKKGYIAANAEGTTKIRVKVTCKSGKKKKTKKTWVQMNITPPEATPAPIYTEDPFYTPAPVFSLTPEPTATPTPATGKALQAFLQINGTAATTFVVSILDNAAGRALYESLPKVLAMTDQNGESKVATDPSSVYTMDEYKPTNLVCGDLMLYGNNKLELTYRDHTTGYAYTRLGRVLNPEGLSTVLGGGAVSATLVRGSIPTATPVPTVTPYRSPTPAPWGSGTPWPSYSPAPGTSATTLPTGVTPAPTAAPTAYSGDVYNVKVGGFSIPFIVDKSSSAAVEFYNDLGAGTQTYEMVKHGTEARYYAALTKQYTERNKTTPPTQWAAGNLVLMGNNEISFIIRTLSNSENRASTIIGTLDKSVLTSDKSTSQFMATYFSGATETVQIQKA